MKYLQPTWLLEALRVTNSAQRTKTVSYIQLEEWFVLQAARAVNQYWDKNKRAVPFNVGYSNYEDNKKKNKLRNFGTAWVGRPLIQSAAGQILGKPLRTLQSFPELN